MARTITIWIACLAVLTACSDERELRPSEGNHLRNLSIQAGFTWRNIFYDYDYFVATNYSGGGSLEGETLYSAFINTSEAHRMQIKVWYPDSSTLIASNIYPANFNLTISFNSNPVYHYSNDLRIRIYDLDDQEEVLDAIW